MKKDDEKIGIYVFIAMVVGIFVTAININGVGLVIACGFILMVIGLAELEEKIDELINLLKNKKEKK